MASTYYHLSSCHSLLYLRRLNHDRISKLPDSLLCHILSFLSAKEAVATSIFSKRWRFLWTWITNIDFDDAKLRESKEIFPKIVYRFLLLRRHDSPIKRLRLKWSCACHSFDLDSWVRAAIAGEVEELDLEAWVREPIQVPPSILSHKALVILRLRTMNALIDVPSSAHLPNLKTLHLEMIQYKDLDSARNLFSACSVLEELTLAFTKMHDGTIIEFPSVCCCVGDSSIRFSNTLVTLRLLYGIELNVPAAGVSFPRLKSLELLHVSYKDDNSVRNLLSGCPVLQKLQIERTHYDKARHYEITSHHVRDLRVRFLVEDEHLQDVRSSQHTLRLNTPAVKYLSLEDQASQHLHIGKMDNLVKATISHLPCDTNHGHDQLDFLKAVRNVTYVVFPSFVMKPFCNIKNFNKFPKFRNVVNLKITKFGGLWGLLQHSLQKLPQLKHLILEKESDIGAMPNEACWMPPQQPLQVPNCLVFHLTTFCLLKFEGSGNEMKFVEYILKNSIVLEMVTLNSLELELEMETRLSILQKLAMFKRGSKNCQLTFD